MEEKVNVILDLAKESDLDCVVFSGKELLIASTIGSDKQDDAYLQASLLLVFRAMLESKPFYLTLLDDPKIHSILLNVQKLENLAKLIKPILARIKDDRKMFLEAVNQILDDLDGHSKI